MSLRETVVWLIEKKKSFYKMVNSASRLDEMRLFMRGKVQEWNCRAGANSLVVRTDGTLAPCFPMYNAGYDWGVIEDHKFEKKQLADMKNSCQPHCFSTLNHILAFCYNDARVIKWMVRQALHRFQGTTNFDKRASFHVPGAASDKDHVVALTESNTNAEVSASLRRKSLKKLSDLPPFSATLNRLMASLAGESVSFAQLGDLIEKDTVVAGNVLNLVNSALYARRGTINSVRHALSILGIDKIRNAVLGMSLTRMWSKLIAPPSWSMARFNQHSAACAMLSDQFAQRLPVEYPEGAFVAGLLHDVGRLLIAMALAPEHDRIQKIRDRTGAPLVECEREVLGFDHAILSADALAVWNIPEPIRIAVLRHHEPGPEISLARIVDAADNFVNSIGVSISGAVTAGPRRMDDLGLEDSARDAVLRDFKGEFDLMMQFFR